MQKKMTHSLAVIFLCVGEKHNFQEELSPLRNLCEIQTKTGFGGFCFFSDGGFGLLSVIGLYI